MFFEWVSEYIAGVVLEGGHGVRVETLKLIANIF